MPVAKGGGPGRGGFPVFPPPRPAPGSWLPPVDKMRGVCIGHPGLTRGCFRDAPPHRQSTPDYEGVIADTLIPEVRLCGRQFELKIDDQTFVGHPSLIDTHTADPSGTSYVFNVVVVCVASLSLSNPRARVCV